MEFPQSLTDDAFETFCCRGAVLRFLMTDLDDPARSERNKYAIVLNVDPSDPEVLLVLTTSNIEWFKTARDWAKNAVLSLAKGSYPWVTGETIVDLRVVRAYPASVFKSAYRTGKLTFHGQLTNTDLQLVDGKLRNSPTITGAMLKRIVRER